MSADNYLYVRKVIDGWKVTEESASSDTVSPPSGPLYKTWEAAYEAAQKMLGRFYVEYGIHSDSIETSEMTTIDYETLSQDVELYHLCPSCGNRYLRNINIEELLERIQEGNIVDKITDDGPTQAL